MVIIKAPGNSLLFSENLLERHSTCQRRVPIQCRVGMSAQFNAFGLGRLDFSPSHFHSHFPSCFFHLLQCQSTVKLSTCASFGVGRQSSARSSSRATCESSSSFPAVVVIVDSPSWLLLSLSPIRVLAK